MAPHLNHDEFFSSLTDLLSKTSQKARGSVFLTQKPLPDTPATSSSTTVPNSQQSILIRASDGNTGAPNPKSTEKSREKVSKNKTPKVKISTIVSPSDLDTFYVRYAEICKSGMTGLKKRDRKRKAKAKGGAAKGTKA